MVLSLKNITLLLSVILLQLFLPSNGQVNLPSTGLSTIIGDKQYFVGTIEPVNWYRANEACAAIGMSLASIESDTENTSLQNFLYNNGILADRFWLAANDLALSKEITWFSTGKKVTYTKWASGQPGGASSKRCIVTNANFQWARESCSSLHYFVCGKPIEPVCGKDNRCLYNYGS